MMERSLLSRGSPSAVRMLHSTRAMVSPSQIKLKSFSVNRKIVVKPRTRLGSVFTLTINWLSYLNWMSTSAWTSGSVYC